MEYVKVHIVQLASELADTQLQLNHPDLKEEDLTEPDVFLDDEGNPHEAGTKFKEEFQDEFNELYDRFYSAIYKHNAEILNAEVGVNPIDKLKEMQKDTGNKEA